jgi:enolase-phosphatase E1
MRAILTDIEGTTSSIAFVADTLFPFARQRVRAHLVAHPEDGQGIAPETFEAWIDADVKEPRLKALQGRIWRAGYESGALRGHVYPDAVAALRRWHAAGLRLFVYSSGSVEAQQLLFGHSEAGDLRPLFEGWFDLSTGAKLDTGSYRTIAARIGLPAADILFLSDHPGEVAAAGAAGLATRLVDRGAGDTLDAVMP